MINNSFYNSFMRWLDERIKVTKLAYIASYKRDYTYSLDSYKNDTSLESRLDKFESAKRYFARHKPEFACIESLQGYMLACEDNFQQICRENRCVIFSFEKNGSIELTNFPKKLENKFIVSSKKKIKQALQKLLALEVLEYFAYISK